MEFEKQIKLYCVLPTKHFLLFWFISGHHLLDWSLLKVLTPPETHQHFQPDLKSAEDNENNFCELQWGLLGSVSAWQLQTVGLKGLWLTFMMLSTWFGNQTSLKKDQKWILISLQHSSLCPEETCCAIAIGKSIKLGTIYMAVRYGKVKKKKKLQFC